MEAPEEIHNVSCSQFSIARYYGGCTFQGKHYVYDEIRDVLIRDDVMIRRAKEGRKAKKAAERKEKKEQGGFAF